MVEVRVLVVADNLLARAGLAALLAEMSAYEVVGQVDGGEGLVDDLDVYRPDVLVWDAGWQAGKMLERLNRLLDEMDESLPLVLLLPDTVHVVEAASMLRTAQAGGVFLRDSPAEQMIVGIGAAGQGLIIIDPALADVVLPAGDVADGMPGEVLTPRELEVLELLAEGLANKIIARRLGISDHTVKFHVNAIMSKLDVQSRTGAVVKATRLGLINL